jgi:hypothetical protein
MLILRPALEMLFERDRYNQGSSKQGTVEAKLEDLVVSNIATQCVLCAQASVKLLSNEIHKQSLKAWWYNVNCKWPSPVKPTLC